MNAVAFNPREGIDPVLQVGPSDTESLEVYEAHRTPISGVGPAL
ncbi:MAG: hypothetical protein AB7I38_11200 [Dehalococcoidia bacterium]